MYCMSLLKGEINYLLVHYLKDDFRQIEQIMLFQIVTDPYGKAGAAGKIYSYTKFDLELPGKGYSF